MTDEELDRLVRNADPYRTSMLAHLDGAEQDLVEEIMSTPTLEPVTEKPEPPRRRLLRPLAGAGVAAAVLAGVLALTVTQDGTTPAPHPTTAPAGTTVEASYSALVLQAAEDNPRLLIRQPGWKVKDVWGFAEKSGMIRFAKGGLSLEMNWRPAEYWNSYQSSRRQTDDPESVTVDGARGELFVFGPGDFDVMLPAAEGAASFVELNSGTGWTRAQFDQVLAAIDHVDVRTWLAALPPEIVTPDRIADRAATVLTGIPLPPGFDTASLADLGTNDAYQFTAGVTGRVGCGWIDELVRARKAGDTAAAARAVAALRSSHRWKALLDIDDEGGWSQVFWETADRIAAGQRPQDYRGSIGCE